MKRNSPLVAIMVMASIYGTVKGEVVNPCEDGIDLGIIVDRSKSVGKENFLIVKAAVKNFVDNFDIQPDGTHLSLIFFAGSPLHLFNLSDPNYHSNKAVKDAIDNLPDRLYGATRTDLALMKAHDHLFHPGQDRRKRPNVLLVLTDGATASESAPYSETVPPLEDKGVNIIAVGIGKGIEKEELEKIAGERGSVVQVADFSLLANKLSEILADVCIINGGYTHWSPWSECSATCGEGFRTRSRNCSNPEPMGGGKNCDEIGPAEEQEACDLPACDSSIDGGYTRWTTWTKCSKTCGTGTQIRVRTCTSPPPNAGGKNCDDLGEPQEVKKCKLPKCMKGKSPCKEGLDLGILIDRSLSIRPRNLERLLKVFFPKFFKRMSISKSKTRIGIIKFDKSATVFAPFNGPNSNSLKKATAFVQGLDPSVYLQTRTDKGLITAYKELYTRKGGDRKRRQNVLLTFTDGRAWPRRRIKPFSLTVPPLREKKKCHMVAVGYGVPTKLNMTQLQEIAGDKAILVPRPRQIRKMVGKIKKAVCQIDGGYSKWSQWSLCSATCGVGVKVRSRTCSAPPPRKKGKDCSRLGDDVETVECNEGECPTGPTPCDKKNLDVCLIVDASLSVGVQNFVRVKSFLVQFVHQFEPGTHFSIITFSGKPHVQCKFSDSKCQGTDNTHDTIAEIPDRVTWGTYTDKALVAADQIVYTPEGGDRPDASNVVVVITDGKTMRGSQPFNVTVPPLREGKNAKVLAFGVGPSIREEDLNEMAGESNWFYVDEFVDMKYRIHDILGIACNNTATLPQ